MPVLMIPPKSRKFEAHHNIFRFPLKSVNLFSNFISVSPHLERQLSSQHNLFKQEIEKKYSKIDSFHIYACTLVTPRPKKILKFYSKTFGNFLNWKELKKKKHSTTYSDKALFSRMHFIYFLVF